MIGWIFQVTVISLCFIAVIHYLYIFFKTTLTVPKVKDLVNRPQQQYEELFKGITNTNLLQPGSGSGLLPSNINMNNANYSSATNTTNISALPSLIDHSSSSGDILNYNTYNNVNNTSINPMKDELKQFLKKLNRT
jgi:hypothetical protein